MIEAASLALVNPHASTAVTIENEKNHRVIRIAEQWSQACACLMITGKSA
jgi:hypothetical protein